MSSLTNSVEAVMGRKLTPDEAVNIASLQRIHEMDDSDPLIIVLALMAKNGLIAESIPNLLQQKAMEMIALHEQTLIRQSAYIAKELIATISKEVVSTNEAWRVRWMRYGGFFLAGALCMEVISFIIKH